MALVGFNGSAIDGSFSVGLSGDPENVASISQAGLVPSDARSLLFKIQPSATVAYRTTDLVSLGGQSLPVVLLTNGPSFMLFGSDISRFAGQTETLSFYSKVDVNGKFMPFALDDIEFSPQIVPEPGGGSLLLVGLGTLASVRKRLHGRDKRPLERRWPPQEVVRWEG